MTTCSDPVRVRVLVLALVLLSGLALGRLARAEEEHPAYTSYEAGPLKAAGLVVVGRTAELSSKRGQQIAWLVIDEVLLGEADVEDRLVVYVHGPHAASDLGAPIESYFPTPDRGRHVYFLGLREASLGVDFRDAFEAEGLEGAEKINAIRREIELSRITDETRRTSETRAYLLLGLKARGIWTRVHAARELQRFALACPTGLDREAEAIVRAMLHRPLPKDLREQLRKLVLVLQRRGRRETPGSERPADTGWQAAFRAAGAEDRATMIEALFASDGSERALAAAWWAFDEGDADLRALVVRRTAGVRARSRLETILAAYAGEAEMAVRREMVRAVGLLGGAEHVAWLEERSANPRLMRTAWLALARIRTVEAVGALERAADALEDSAEDEDRRNAQWLRFLLSDAFAASDQG